jgi:hypothetical protein
MSPSLPAQYSAFVGSRLISAGPLSEVALAVKRVIEGGEQRPPVIFDADTSQIVDVDFRGTDADVTNRLSPAGTAEPEQTADDDEEASPYREVQTRTRGRPKLGVVAREVTLLPRHWDWLASQPGGASAAVRRLVDAARQANAGTDRARQAKESTYRFISAMAGNEAGFEEATRALFAGNPGRFIEMTESWPPDVRDHARRLGVRAFA